jgi:hypothetical protein
LILLCKSITEYLICCVYMLTRLSASHNSYILIIDPFTIFISWGVHSSIFRFLIKLCLRWDLLLWHNVFSLIKSHLIRIYVTLLICLRCFCWVLWLVTEDVRKLKIIVWVLTLCWGRVILWYCKFRIFKLRRRTFMFASKLTLSHTRVQLLLRDVSINGSIM